MSKKIILFVFSVCAVFCILCSACQTASDENKPETADIQSVKTVEERSEMDKMAYEAGERMLAALRSGDFNSFSRDFDDSFRQNIKESDFRELHVGLGNFTNSEYLCSLHNPLFAAYLWKLTFPRQSGDKKLTFETLFQISVIKQDDRFYVAGCWFR